MVFIVPIIIFIIIQVGGTIVAPTNIQAWTDKEKWIKFTNINGLIVKWTN